MAAPKKATRRTAGESIAKKEPFKASALSGVAGMGGVGRMSDDELREYRQSNPSYTVMSYNTPIAWHGDKGWHVSTSRYSPTTSQHQGVVRRALFDQGHDASRNHVDTGVPTSNIKPTNV